MSAKNVRRSSDVGHRGLVLLPVPSLKRKQRRQFHMTRSISQGSSFSETQIADIQKPSELDLLKPRAELWTRYSLYPDPDDSGSEYDTDLEPEAPTENDSLGTSVYISACTKNHIVPLGYVIRNLKNSTLKMTNIGLRPKDVLALSMPLLTNLTVTELNLADNSIGSDGMAYLAEMLKENVSIKSLNLANNDLGRDGIVLLGEVIEINTTLRYLNVSGNKFSDTDISHLATPLKNARLRTVDLSHNEFRVEGGKILAHVIAENDMLEELNLSWNHLRLKGAVAVAKGLKENVTIRRLDFSWNGFSNDGALSVSRALKENRTLKELDLSSNRINIEGIIHLCDALKINDTLEVLKLNGNSIGTNAAEKLLESINRSRSCCVKRLEFTDTEINPRSAMLSRQIRTKRPGFTVLYSRSVFYDDPYSKKILEKDSWFGDPLRILLEYMRDNNFRLMDLFKEFDRDSNWIVTLDEFRKGVKLAKIPLSDLQLEQLIEKLDGNRNGEIDFSEMVVGHRKFRSKERRRKVQIDSLEKLRSDVGIKTTMQNQSTSSSPGSTNTKIARPSTPRPSTPQTTSLRSKKEFNKLRRGSLLVQKRRVSRVTEGDEIVGKSPPPPLPPIRNEKMLISDLDS